MTSQINIDANLLDSVIFATHQVDKERGLLLLSNTKLSKVNNASLGKKLMLVLINEKLKNQHKSSLQKEKFALNMINQLLIRRTYINNNELRQLNM